MNNLKKKHEVSRKTLSKIILSALENSQVTTDELARATEVGKSTVHNLKAGTQLSLPTLCRMVSSAPEAFMLSPENAAKILSRIITESISGSGEQPEFKIVATPEESMHNRLPKLPGYLKEVREKKLKLSKNKVETHLCCSYYRQITKIEKDCHGVGIGPICNLFYHYMQEFTGPTDEEWNIFATLVFQKLFPKMTGYRLEVTRRRQE